MVVEEWSKERIEKAKETTSRKNYLPRANISTKPCFHIKNGLKIFVDKHDWTKGERCVNCDRTKAEVRKHKCNG